MNNEINKFIMSFPFIDVFKNLYGNERILIKDVNNNKIFMNFTELMIKYKRKEQLFIDFLSLKNVKINKLYYYENTILHCSNSIDLETLFNEFIEVFCRCPNCKNDRTEYDEEKGVIYMFCNKCTESYGKVKKYKFNVLHTSNEKKLVSI
jgi:hypothetical protein